jgi:hypothetical protein
LNEKELQEKAKIYATSAAALGGGVKEPGAEVEEAAEGVIRDTMPGAYTFAFLKNPSSSERGRAREELIFSQSTSSPCG